MQPLFDLTGRRAVVTGANTGIGRVTAVALAKAGARVVLAGRSREKTEPVVDEIRAAGGDASFLPLDLARLDGVREAAAALLASGEPIHLLVNNAGLAGQRGLTADGFELTFGVNHLGPFLFTALLTERLVASAPARVVVVASRAHYRAEAIDWDALRRTTRTVTGFPEYGVSKLCNVLHAAELGRRLAGTGVTTYALHPGVVATDVWRRVPWGVRHLMRRFMLTAEDGARTQLWCATAPELAGQTGRYYDDCRPKRPSRLALDESLAAELWRRSAAWAGAGA